MTTFVQKVNTHRYKFTMTQNARKRCWHVTFERVGVMSWRFLPTVDLHVDVIGLLPTNFIIAYNLLQWHTGVYD